MNIHFSQAKLLSDQTTPHLCGVHPTRKNGSLNPDFVTCLTCLRMMGRRTN